MAKDKPETYDPHVKALGGFDVTSMTVAELEREGVELSGPIVAVAVGTNPVWLTHSEFLARQPQHDDVDRAYARAAAHLHYAKTGNLEGLTLLRSFPCLGMLRVVNPGNFGPIVEVQCDVCGDAYGVPRDRGGDDDGKPVASSEFAAGF